jgi:hypothetical protein
MDARQTPHSVALEEGEPRPVLSVMATVRRGPQRVRRATGGAAVATWHVGPHDGLGDAYRRLEGWLKAHGRAPDGAAWEVYRWIDAGVEPTPSAWPAPPEWRTPLIQPIK